MADTDAPKEHDVEKDAGTARLLPTTAAEDREPCETPATESLVPRVVRMTTGFARKKPRKGKKKPQPNAVTRIYSGKLKYLLAQWIVYFFVLGPSARSLAIASKAQFVVPKLAYAVACAAVHIVGAIPFMSHDNPTSPTNISPPKWYLIGSAVSSLAWVAATACMIVVTVETMPFNREEDKSHGMHDCPRKGNQNKRCYPLTDNAMIAFDAQMSMTATIIILLTIIGHWYQLSKLWRSKFTADEIMEAHEYEPHAKKNTSKQRKNAKRNMQAKGIRLTDPGVAMVSRKIARTFGVQDLYADATNSTDTEHIEGLLGTLEDQASEIIAQVRSKHLEGSKLITLKRAEKDVLRKFLFIMKYRRPDVRDKYACSIEDFDGIEKEALQEYMQQRGFQRPLDVWLNNIKAMLEIKIDAGCKWEKELLRKAYPPDAREFIVHTRLFYLSFCAPSNQDDEFLMTENSYGIHEGPKSTFSDPHSGKVLVSFYTEYHTFAHIAPNLTMILRSFLLRSPGDSSSEDIAEILKELQDFNISMHDFPERATSFLKDLPVAKARNSYTKMENGRVVLLRPGSILKPEDKFRFRIFPISTDHVNKINMILLDEAWPTSLILFKTERSARNALENYLNIDPLSTSHGLKLIFPGTDTLREAYFRNLQTAVKLLGGNAVAAYRFDDGTLEGVLTRDADQLIDLISQNDETLQAYYKLSNKDFLDREDFRQSREMLKRRIKIDTNTKGRDEDFRNRAREDLIHEYWKLPPQQFWIYLKRHRFLMNGGTILGLRSDVHDYPLPAELLSGPEDVIAKKNLAWTRKALGGYRKKGELSSASKGASAIVESF
ncbi:hypothetical protein V492_01919 [Pseudogymnoascus sp. VKM F-4246]|nr:hypothetical protein V492_01919 [Pseudogymnoascus sp. VKM F-4246]